MYDIIMMMVVAGGALVLALGFLLALGALATAVSPVAGSVVVGLCKALPVVAIAGGVGFAASRTGYGGPG